MVDLTILETLKKYTPREINILCTHLVLSSSSILREDSINRIFTTNTLERPDIAIDEKIKFLDISKGISKKIKDILAIKI